VERAQQQVQAGDLGTALGSTRETREIAQRGFLTDDCPWVDVRRDRFRTGRSERVATDLSE
jgi:hypothetical protein